VQIELSGFEIVQDLLRIAPAGGVVTGELALRRHRVAMRDGFPDQLARERGARLAFVPGVAGEAPAVLSSSVKCRRSMTRAA
jgi:hypothetical protein